MAGVELLGVCVVVNFLFGVWLYYDLKVVE